MEISDNRGNRYVTGSFDTAITFAGLPPLTTSGTDMYVAKMDSSGTYEWAIIPSRMLGWNTPMIASDIALDLNGCIYLTGCSATGRCVVTKLDTRGKFIWYLAHQ